MARTWIVIGDATSGGGRVITGSPHTDIEGKPVARLGDKATCPRHKGVFGIVSGDLSIIIDGQPVAREGDRLACGCSLIAGQQRLAWVEAGGAGAGNRGVVAATAAFAGMQASSSAEHASAAPVQAQGVDYTLHYHYDDLDQTPMRGVAYKVMLADDSVRTGTLDDEGKATLGNVQVGPLQVLYQHDLDDADDRDIQSARHRVEQALDAIVRQTRQDFAAEWAQWQQAGPLLRGGLKLGNSALGSGKGAWDYLSGTAETLWQVAVVNYKLDRELEQWKLLLLTGDRAGLDRKIADYRAQGGKVMEAASEMKALFNLLIDDPAIVVGLPRFAADWWEAIPPDEAEGIKARYSSQIILDVVVSVILAAVTIEAGGAGGFGYATAKASITAARIGRQAMALLDDVKDAFVHLSKALRMRKRRLADSDRRADGRQVVESRWLPTRMPEKKLPCFSPQKLPADKYPEMDRQLAGQQQGLNDMTVQEYLDGRAAYGKGSRDPKVARKARNDHQDAMYERRLGELTKSGHSYSEAAELARNQTDEAMGTLHALHNPDLVAGGQDEIADFGDGEVNSTIGRQWNSARKDSTSRVRDLDQAAKEVPVGERSRTAMNGKLERCK
ncbi:PAAR motif protein [compost metagenome]